MPFHPSTALVMFDVGGQQFTEQVAADILLRDPQYSPGFVRVVRLYHFITGALIEVDPHRLDDFVVRARDISAVKFVTRNALLVPASAVRHPQIEAAETRQMVRAIHGASAVSIDAASPPDAAAGLGVRVGLIDTGVAWHRDLPSLTVTGAREAGRGVSGVREAAILKSLEQELEKISMYEVHNEPLVGSYQDWCDYVDVVQRFVLAEERKSDSVFLQRMSIWVDGARNAIASGRYSSFDDVLRFEPPVNLLPARPRAWRGVTGCLSHLSYNFVADNPDVRDSHGHGTAMLSVLAGSSDGLAPGMAPSADYIAYKSFDINSPKDSNVAAMLGAFERACLDECDLVYVGLAVDPNEVLYNDGVILGKAVEQVARKGLQVICPAGNHGASKLAMPAAFTPHARAVGACEMVGSGRVGWAAYSNTASPSHGQVMWASAFGGSERLALFLANNRLGYSPEYGTSVAAALACGILAASLSEEYLREERVQMATWLKQWVVVSVAGSHPPMPAFRSYDFIDRSAVVAKHASRMGSVDGADALQVGGGLLMMR